ncbi:MAG: Rpn family recombination-promoting nuclease/putative transposase [Treponema sp.]|nr:Rpn family recombination-promoting nuclease/putative transposase [Treponema sp.]
MAYHKDREPGVPLFAENDDPIDICLDNVFKAVFTRNTPESQGALSKLLSAIIGRDLAVVTLSANEPPIDNIRDRQIRFDINCKAENGELVNVEMSLNPDPFEPVRLEFHAGKLFTAQDIRGSGKSYNDLKEAYQIAFLVKERFFADGDFFHRFEYYDPARLISLGGRSRIITLELSKLEAVAEKPAGSMSGAEHWAVFLKYLTDKKKRRKINEIAEYAEGVAMAGEVLLSISRDEVERARLMSEYKYELDTQSKLVEATRAGERKKAIEVARKLKTRNVSADQIAEDTGLSLEEIAKL